MFIFPSVLPVSFKQLDKLLQHIKIQSDEQKESHRPNDRNVEEQGVKIKAPKMLRRLIEVR